MKCKSLVLPLPNSNSPVGSWKSNSNTSHGKKGSKQRSGHSPALGWGSAQSSVTRCWCLQGALQSSAGASFAALDAQRGAPALVIRLNYPRMSILCWKSAVLRGFSCTGTLAHCHHTETGERETANSWNCSINKCNSWSLLPANLVIL